MISTLDRAALRAEARAFFGLDADRPTLLVTGGSQGARRLNQSVSGAAARAGAPPASRCCTWSARRARPTPRGDRAPPYVVVAFVDRMDLAYAAADLVVCRAGANTVTEAAAVGLPAVFVPLPIGNGEQELNAAPGGRRRRRPAGRRRARSRPEWVAATVPGLVTDADRLAAMGAAAAAADPARRRRQAGADRRCERGARGEGPGPRRAAARRPARPRALRRHRRRRALRASPGSCCARGITVSGSDGHGLADPAGAARRSAPRCHVGHDAAHVADADTLVVSTAVREDNPEVRRGARAAACGCCRDRPALAVGDARPPGARGRRHPRQDHDDLAAHRRAAARPAPTRRTPSAATSPQTGRQRRTTAPATLFVAEADESDGAFLVYSPVRRDRDQRRGRPPRQLRAPRRPTARRSTSSSTGSTPTGFLVVLRRRPRRRRPRRAGPRARPDAWSAWGSPTTADLRAADLRFAGTHVLVTGRSTGESPSSAR